MGLSIKTPTTWVGYLICYVIGLTILFSLRYLYKAKHQLTQAEYLIKLQELGYDVSDVNKVLEDAKRDVMSIQTKLDKVYKEAGINYKCPARCYVSRHTYSCCDNAQSSHQRNAKTKAHKSLPQRDQDLLKYYDNYTTDYKQKIAIEYLVTVIGIPIVVLGIMMATSGTIIIL